MAEVTQHSRSSGHRSKKSRFPLREQSVTLGALAKPIVFNPTVTICTMIGLLSVVLWASVEPESALDFLLTLRGLIARHFAWFFQGSKVIFFIFLLYVGIRYGDIKLSVDPDISPEYSDLNFFGMIFATGVGVGVYVYGVAEPLYHQSSHFFERAGYRTQDEIDMFALNMAVTNWGISGWSCYLIVSLAVGLATHRFGMPLLFRSAFYPMLGEYTWGWIGDLIDSLAITVTFCGVCTSLGLATFQLFSAFRFMGWFHLDSISDGLTLDAGTKFIQVSVIWTITLMSTISVVSGINGGIRYLSYVALALGFFLLILILALDDTAFLLNLTVQEVGVYLQRSLLELNFWTDAFGQLPAGNGRSVDGLSAELWWMDAWTIFYQAWWVSWAAFAGMLTAKISKGRTIREIIAFSALAPIAVCLVWFCVWGGAGLRQHRQALELEHLGTQVFGNNRYFNAEMSDFCFDVPQEDIVINGTMAFIASNAVRGVTPVCKFNSGEASLAAFHVLYSYTFGHERGFGPFLGGLFVFAMTVSFITSSDSSSLIIDLLASNGRERNAHWIRRASWSVMEGVIATSLILAGGSQALQAVRASAIVVGLPFCGLLLFLVPAISDYCAAVRRRDITIEAERRMLRPLNATVTHKRRRKELFQHPRSENEFDMPLYGGVFNVFEFVACCGQIDPDRKSKHMHLPTGPQVHQTVLAAFVPFVGMHQILCCTGLIEHNLTKFATVASYSLAYAAWTTTAIAGLFGFAGLLPWSLASFLFCGVILSGIRKMFRTKYHVRSGVVYDILGSTLMWPQVICQMRIQCFNLPSDKKIEEPEVASMDPIETNYNDWNSEGLNVTVFA